MAFSNLPGIKPGPVSPAIGPLTNPATPQLQPEMSGRGQAKINMKSANTSSYTQSKPRPSGKRVGGKSGAKRKNKDNARPVIPFPIKSDGNYGGNRSSLTITPSDFGFDINGSEQPNIYVDSRDQTPFRDYNQRSDVTKTLVNGKVSTFSQVTNQFKLMTINPKEANNFPGYLSQINVILDLVHRDVVSGTRAAKGAIDALNDLPEYLNVVPVAFATLIQIEGLQAWNPSDNAYFDRSLRLLASKMSGTELLELRTQLRQALIPHILPVGWMKFLKWIYGAYLRNHCPESTKLRFVDGETAKLIGLMINDKEITDYRTYVGGLVTQIRNLNQTIPSIILSNVNCIEFANCKDHYDGMHNSATYDAEFNNIFNNRRVCWLKGTATGTEINYYPTSETNYYMCVDTTSPYSMVLSQASRQAGDKQPGLPLEGKQEVVKVDGATDKFQRFYIDESPGGIFQFLPVTTFMRDNTDSIHRVDLSVADIDNGPSYSMPAGIQSLAIIVSDANCQMAARESLNTMTLK